MKTKLILLYLLWTIACRPTPEVTSQPAPVAEADTAPSTAVPDEVAWPSGDERLPKDVPGFPSLAELLNIAFPEATIGEAGILVAPLRDPLSNHLLPFGLTAKGGIQVNDWLVLVVNASLMRNNGLPDINGVADDQYAYLNLIWFKKQPERWEVRHEQNIAPCYRGVRYFVFQPYGQGSCLLAFEVHFMQWGDAWHRLNLLDLHPGASVKRLENLPVSIASGGNASTPCYLLAGKWSFQEAAQPANSDAPLAPELLLSFKGQTYKKTGNDKDECHCGPGWAIDKALKGQATYRFKEGQYQLAEGTNLAQELDHGYQE